MCHIERTIPANRSAVLKQTTGKGPANFILKRADSEAHSQHARDTSSLGAQARVDEADVELPEMSSLDGLLESSWTRFVSF